MAEVQSVAPLTNNRRRLFVAAAPFAQRLIAPSYCQHCHDYCPSSRLLCDRCGPALDSVPLPAPSELDAIPVYSSGLHQGVLAQSVRALKYSGATHLAQPLGQRMRMALPAALARIDVIVPVPLHAVRLAERGYNQSALLARTLAKELRIPLLATALRRQRATLPQAHLGREQRCDNLRQAFAPADITPGSRLLLVDDVITTGSTLRSCSDALRQAGGQVVCILTTTQAPLPPADASRAPTDASVALAVP